MFALTYSEELTHWGGWLFEKREPDYWVVNGVADGALHYRFPQVEYEAEKGDISLWPPGLLKRVSVEKDGHARLYSLKFLDPRNQLQDVTEPLLIKGGLTPAAKGHLEAICDLNIYEEVRTELFVQGHLMLILDGILSHGRQGEPRRSVPVRKALDILSSRLEEKTDMARLGGELGISPGYLGSLFKEEMGVSLRKYARNLRIRRAIQFFYYPELSLSDIALKCGFNDVFYFSKAFKEYTGKAPRDYRREITREL